VLDELLQDAAQVAWAGDEHAVGALVAYGAHEALRVRVHPRGLWRGLDDLDADRTKHGVEGVGELRVAVPDQVGEAVPGVFEGPRQFAGELGGPGGGGVLGDPEQVYAAGVEFDDERDVEPGECDGAVDVEEVCGEQGRRVGARERVPRVVPVRGRRDPVRSQDPADGGGGDPMSEPA